MAAHRSTMLFAALALLALGAVAKKIPKKALLVAGGLPTNDELLLHEGALCRTYGLLKAQGWTPSEMLTMGKYGLKDLKKSEDGRFHKNRVDIICSDVKTDGGISAQREALSPKSVIENMQGLTDKGDILLVFLWGVGVDLGKGKKGGKPASLMEMSANATGHRVRATYMRMSKPGGGAGSDMSTEDLQEAQKAMRSGELPEVQPLEGNGPEAYDFGDNPALGFPAYDRIIRSNYGGENEMPKSPFMPWKMFAEGVVEMFKLPEHKFKSIVIMGDFFNSGSFFDWIRKGSRKQKELADGLKMDVAEIDKIPIFALATVPDDTEALPPFEKVSGHPTQYKFMEMYAQGGIMGGKTFKSIVDNLKAEHFMTTVKYFQNAYATSFAMMPQKKRPRDYKTLVKIIKKRNPAIMKKMGWNEPLMFHTSAFPIDKDLADFFFEGTSAIVPPNSEHNAFFYAKAGGVQLKKSAGKAPAAGSGVAQLPGQPNLDSLVPKPCSGKKGSAFLECQETITKSTAKVEKKKEEHKLEVVAPAAEIGKSTADYLDWEADINPYMA